MGRGGPERRAQPHQLRPSPRRTRLPQLSTLNRVYTFGLTLLAQDQLLNGLWTVRYRGMDGHGNTRYLTDVLGDITDTYDYDAFGNIIAATGSTPNNFLFTGEQLDPDLGLYFLRARYQDATTGRFWTMDTFEGADYDVIGQIKTSHWWALQNRPV